MRRPYNRKPPLEVPINAGHPQLDGCVLFMSLREPSYKIGATYRASASSIVGTVEGSDLAPGNNLDYVRLIPGQDGSIKLSPFFSFTSNDSWSVVASLIPIINPNYHYILGSGNSSFRLSSKSQTQVFDESFSRHDFNHPNLIVGKKYTVVLTYDGVSKDMMLWWERTPLTLNGARTLKWQWIGGSGGTSGNGGYEFSQVRIYNKVLPYSMFEDIRANLWAPFSRELPVWIPSTAPSTGGVGGYIRRPYTRKPPAGVALNRGHPQLQGCSEYWPMLERGGATTRNVMGDSNSLSFQGDAAWVGRGIEQTNAGSGYLLADNSFDEGVDFTTLTIEMSFIEIGGVEEKGLFGIQSSPTDGGNPPLVCQLTYSWGYRFFVNNGWYNGDTVLLNGRHNQIGLTWDGTDFLFYLNGEPDGSVLSSAWLGDSADKILYVGSGYNGQPGIIHEQFRVFKDVVKPASYFKDSWVNPWAPFSRNVPYYLPGTGEEPVGWQGSFNEILAPASVDEIASIASVNEVT